MKRETTASLGILANETILPVDERNELILGSGYDMLADEHSDAIVAVPYSEQAPSDADGLKIYYFADIIEDTEKFRETLNVSISASAKGFGGKASASYSLLREIQIDSNNVFALVHVYVIDSIDTLVDPRLSDAAQSEWRRSKASERKRNFVRVFGDSYVSRIVRGGEFLGLFKLHATSRKERERIKISARASFGAFKASGSYEKLTEFFSSHTHTTLSVKRIGGSGPLPKADVASLLAAAEEFPDLVDSTKGGRPVQLYFSAKPTGRIPHPDFNFDLSSRPAYYLVEDIGKLKEKILDRSADATFAIDVPELFPLIEKADLRHMLDQLEVASVSATRLYDEVISKRFDDLSLIEVQNIDTLPLPPKAVSGAPVPMMVHLATRYPYGSIWDVSGASGEWIDSKPALFGIRLECDALPAGTTIKYKLFDETGAQGEEARVGSTATVKNVVAYGIEMSLEGDLADNYSLRYAVRTSVAGGATYYAQNGEKLAPKTYRAWLINGIQVCLFVA